MGKPTVPVEQGCNMPPKPADPNRKVSEAVKRFRGRPKTYPEDFPDRLIDYFAAPLRTKKITQQATASGKIVEVETEEFRDPATVEGFCASQMISKETFYRWVREYPEFSNAFDACKQMQADMLIIGSMKGEYASSISKLVLANCTDYRESKEVEHTGEVKLNYTAKSKEE